MPEKIMQGLGPDELPQPSRQVAEPGVVTTDLGQIMPIPRGVYDPAATYRYLDIVQYTGCSYICRKETLTGVAPIDGANWMLLTDKNGALPTGGGAMTGPIEMSGNRITGLGDPAADGDAVNLKTLNSSVLPTILSVLGATIDGSKILKIFDLDNYDPGGSEVLDGTRNEFVGSGKNWAYVYTIPGDKEYLLAPMVWYFFEFLQLSNVPLAGIPTTLASLCVLNRRFTNWSAGWVLPSTEILTSSIQNGNTPGIISMGYNVSQLVMPPPYNTITVEIPFVFDTSIDLSGTSLSGYTIARCYRYIPQITDGGALNA